jgi:transposase
MKAMSKPIQLGEMASLESLDAAYKTSYERHDRERLLAMRLAYQGNQTLEQIGVILKRGRATIARWVKAYREGGIQKLLHRGHGGRKASLSHTDQKAMIEELYSGRWKRSKDIQIWLHEKRGIDLKLGGIYYWLYKLKSSWKVPRPKHKNQNPDEVEEFKKEIVSNLEALDVPNNRTVHVWVEDEHRYGLISVLRRCWTVKGHRVTAPRQMKYEWSYVYAAADIVTSSAEFLHTPTVSSEWTQVFLKQLIATDPEGIHIIIWDRAGYHPTVLTNELAESVRFLPLPAYSPELNPIEPLWDQVKLRVANDIWETLDSIGYAIDEVLEPFWKRVMRVWSLLGNTWLTRGVIIFLQHRLE